MEYKYDPEADILAITISKRPFAYAEEMGDIIVHFDKKNKPVYIEILNANKFLGQAMTSLPQPSREAILHYLQSSSFKGA